ncbi:FtsQ-type POTRA domain-containing protein [Microbacterium soli]|uniref:POTRA domain-containing protein n=1 Tax=Microbacterium soli TaxID=446075 RepID=A0ABP7NFR5_9MICO
MRRPAPLPAPAEEPAETTAAASRPRRRWPRASADAAGRVGAEGADAGSARAVGTDAVVGTSTPDAVRPPVAADDATPTIPVEPVDLVAAAEALASAEIPAAPISSGDVWRAARARRRALRAEIRRFTQRSRRRRIIWWSTTGALGVLLVGSVGAAYSPLFAVETITVTGTRAMDRTTVQQALSAQIGTPLALVDSDEVRAALTEFPLIESYAVEAHPPHDLVVRIVERTPVGVIRTDGGYTLVDAAGVELAAGADRPEGQPVLSVAGGTDTAAFRSAGQVVRSLPGDLRGQVAEVRASTMDDVTLVLADGKSVVWGSAEESALKALVLVALIDNSPGSRSFDVSAPGVPVVR